MITEDIDVSWKIQTAGYNIMYEPRALCWVLMPERLYGLYKQRLRWAIKVAQKPSSNIFLRSGDGNPPSMANVCRIFCYRNLGNLIIALVALALYRKITLGIGIQNMELFETNISIMFFLLLTVSLELIYRLSL